MTRPRQSIPLIGGAVRPDPERARLLVNADDPDFARICAVLREWQSYGFDVTDPVVTQRAVDVARHRRRLEEHGAERIGRVFGPVLPPMAAPSVVYYMRIGNRCKIGFTTDLAARMATFYPEEVLAIEPGGVLLEGERHRQFRDLRTVGEWFRYEGTLAEHVAQLQRRGAS